VGNGGKLIGSVSNVAPFASTHAGISSTAANICVHDVPRCAALGQTAVLLDGPVAVEDGRYRSAGFCTAFQALLNDEYRGALMVRLDGSGSAGAAEAAYDNVELFCPTCHLRQPRGATKRRP
jgi:hypothetical protein